MTKTHFEACRKATNTSIEASRRDQLFIEVAPQEERSKGKSKKGANLYDVAQLGLVKEKVVSPNGKEKINDNGRIFHPLINLWKVFLKLWAYPNFNFGLYVKT